MAQEASLGGKDVFPSNLVNLVKVQSPTRLATGC